MPGVPQAPTVLFAEDWENRQSTTPILLTDYTGVQGETYTADPAWLTHCNGIISAFIDPPSSDPAAAPWVAACTGPIGAPGATAWNNVRNLAYGLGVVDGTPDPSTNHAVSAYTNGADPGANKVEFETVQPIAVPSGGKFLTFSVNAAEMNCGHNHALLEFFLVDGQTEIPAFSTPIEPCVDGSPVSAPNPTAQIFAGSFVANSPILYNNTSLRIRMRNAQGSGDGNDHAFDDIRLLDVTPQLDKSFSPTNVPVGGTSTLTFTITNTNELAAKNGWSFTDSLPAGLTLASPSGASTTCSNGNVSAPAGGTSVSVTGNLNAGQASCTVTVNVTSTQTGTFTDNASNITSSVGVNPPGESSVTFVAVPAPSLSLTKSASPSTVTEAGQTINYSYTVTNTGNTPITDVRVADTAFSGTGTPPVINCPVTTLVPGESTTCTGTYVVTQADVNAGRITNTATATGTSADGQRVQSSPSTAVVTISPTPTPTPTPTVRSKKATAVSGNRAVAANNNRTRADLDIRQGHATRSLSRDHHRSTLNARRRHVAYGAHR